MSPREKSACVQAVVTQRNPVQMRRPGAGPQFSSRLGGEDSPMESILVGRLTAPLHTHTLVRVRLATPKPECLSPVLHR